MRRILPFLLVPALCMTVHAQSTGRVSGKVTDSAGKGIPNVKLIYKRTDINQQIEIVTSADGRYFRIMDPKLFEIIIEHPGFAKHMDQIKVPLGSEEKKTFVLLTPEEMSKKAGAAGAIADPSLAAQNDSSTAYNTAVSFYNQQKYQEAFPLAEKAYAGMKLAIEKAKTEEAKKDALDKIAPIEKMITVLYYEVGKADEARRTELWTKAEPALIKQLEANPKSLQFLSYLLDISKHKQDAAGEQKYTAAIEAIQGPDPKKAYNEGVEFYNTNKFPEAKKAFQRAIEIDAKYAEAFYMLGMVDFNQNNLKGAKINFLKSIELAPAGPKAAEIKEFLADPSLKSIKIS